MIANLLLHALSADAREAAAVAALFSSDIHPASRLPLGEPGACCAGCRLCAQAGEGHVCRASGVRTRPVWRGCRGWRGWGR